MSNNEELVSKTMSEYKEEHDKYISLVSASAEEILKKALSALEDKHTEETLFHKIEHETELEMLHESYNSKINAFKSEIIKTIDAMNEEYNQRCEELKEMINNFNPNDDIIKTDEQTSTADDIEDSADELLSVAN